MGTRNAIKTVITISYKMILLALIVMLIYYVGGAAYRFGVAIFNESSVDSPEHAKTVTVTLPENPSMRQIAEILDKAGVVESPLLFYIQALLSNYNKYFTGGVFEVNTGMTPTQIIASITEKSREEAKAREEEENKK